MGAQSSVPHAADVAAFLTQASQADEAEALLALRQFAGLP
jgi:hypothetical protein